MSIEQMKDWILKAYSGPAWKDKVSKMSDNQIIAVYHRLLYSGKLK